MAAFSDYLEGKIIDSTLRGQTFPTISTIWVGLSSAAPVDAGTTNEITAGGYARVSVSATTAAFSAHGANGPSSNGSAISFSQATTSWGTISHVFIADASTGGNVLYHGALTASKTVAANDTFQIAANDLDITLD